MSNEVKSEDYEKGYSDGYSKCCDEDREFAATTKHKFIRDAALQVFLKRGEDSLNGVDVAVGFASTIWSVTGDQ